MKLERDYQPKLIKKLERMFPDAIILKNNSAYRQGVPDLLLLCETFWATLEVKRKKPRPGSDDFEPNQEWYIKKMNEMSFSACIYPENEKEVLNEIQQAYRSSRHARLPFTQ